MGNVRMPPPTFLNVFPSAQAPTPAPRAKMQPSDGMLLAVRSGNWELARAVAEKTLSVTADQGQGHKSAVAMMTAAAARSDEIGFQHFAAALQRTMIAGGKAPGTAEKAMKTITIAAVCSAAGVLRHMAQERRNAGDESQAARYMERAEATIQLNGAVHRAHKASPTVDLYVAPVARPVRVGRPSVAVGNLACDTADSKLKLYLLHNSEKVRKAAHKRKRKHEVIANQLFQEDWEKLSNVQRAKFEADAKDPTLQDKVRAKFLALRRW